MKYKDLEKNNNSIQFDRGSEPDDEFIEMEIISPYNKQKITCAWVPEVMADLLQAEIDLTETSRFHDWTSLITEELYDREFENASSLKRAIRKFYREYKKKYKFIILDSSRIDWNTLSNGKLYIENSGISIVY